MYNVPSSQRVGDTCQVHINNTLQFDGYVARTQRTIDAGVLFSTYQLIGKTYDLWRYHTNATTSYSGATSYMASSLVADFCTGISANIIPSYCPSPPSYTWSGTNFNEKLNFYNMTIGDALIELIGYDGYKFYVDSDNILQYYKPSIRSYDFTVTEANILDMTPIEEADEDLVNDVTVIGSSTDYTTQTNVAPRHMFSSAFPSGILVAQRFKAEDTRLSAVQFYLNRTVDPNQPGTLNFEIWNDSSKQLFEDDFDDESYLDNLSNMQIYESKLILNYNQSETQSYEGTTPMVSRKYHAERFSTPAWDGTVISVRMRCVPGIPQDHPVGYYDWVITICSSNSSSEPAYSNPEKQVTKYDVYSNGGYNYVEFLYTGSVVFRASESYWLVYSLSDGGSFQVDATTLGAARYKYSNDASSWTTSVYDSVSSRIIMKTYKTNGVASSNKYTQACQYMKADFTDVISSSRIYVSGTNNNGTTWMELINDTWVDFGSESSAGAFIKYKFSSNDLYTPSIGKCVVDIGDSAGSSQGTPESGNKVEFGDDISWTAGSIPYPPSYNSWKTYSDPKLRLTKDRTYWMVMWHNSGNNAYWSYYYHPDFPSYSDGGIKYSWKTGDAYMTGWSSQVQIGNLTFKLGWATTTEGVSATAENQDSIDLYGRHYKLINDSTITTNEGAQARADYEVSGMEVLKKKGSITIEGREDMSVNYRLSSNLTNFGIDEIWDVVSYSQIIDKRGFTTNIEYNKHNFDFIKHLSDLEKEVF